MPSNDKSSNLAPTVTGGGLDLKNPNLNDGFPNGVRPNDDVTEIALRAAVSSVLTMPSIGTSDDSGQPNGVIRQLHRNPIHSFLQGVPFRHRLCRASN